MAKQQMGSIQGMGREGGWEGCPCWCLGSGTSLLGSWSCQSHSWCPWPAPTSLQCHFGDTEAPGADCTWSGLQELSWERKGLKAAHILSRNLQVRRAHNTNSFFLCRCCYYSFWLKKKKGKKEKKNLFYIWYNTGSQRKAIVQQILTTNTHLISSVALWETKCMSRLIFNVSKNLYYWNM